MHPRTEIQNDRSYSPCRPINASRNVRQALADDEIKPTWDKFDLLQLTVYHTIAQLPLQLTSRPLLSAALLTFTGSVTDFQFITITTWTAVTSLCIVTVLITNTLVQLAFVYIWNIEFKIADMTNQKNRAYTGGHNETWYEREICRWKWKLV
jgi:hypothetical protein